MRKMVVMFPVDFQRLDPGAWLVPQALDGPVIMESYWYDTDDLISNNWATRQQLIRTIMEELISEVTGNIPRLSAIYGSRWRITVNSDESQFRIDAEFTPVGVTITSQETLDLLFPDPLHPKNP